MARAKKKLTYTALEEHVVGWFTDKLESLRESEDRLEEDESIHPKHKELVRLGMAQEIKDLLELAEPFAHDEECLIDWAQSFVLEHPIIEDALDC